MIYSRMGVRLTVQRLATAADVRKPSKDDLAAIAQSAYVMATREDGSSRVYHISDLKADNGAAEINAVIAACKANGGRAP